MKARNQLLSILTSLAVLFLFCAVVGAPLPVQAQTVQVLSADPPSATQGTVNLNVLIKGKGFKRGAIAKFLVTGTNDPGGIKVNSTTYVGATSLTANIDVADTAVLSKFDIQVMNSDGRGGKGTELFSVTKKQTACVVPPPEPTGGYCFASGPGPGIAGCLDTNFGGGTGRVMLPAGMWVRGIAMQNVAGEARIVVVGNTGDPCLTDPSEVWTVLRYHSDGTVDTSFGPDGTGVIKGVGPSQAGKAFAVVVQPDNKLVVAGDSPVGKLDYLPTVARYTQDGLLDTSFGGGDGLVTVPYAKDPRHAGWANAVALQQSDGKIVATGCYIWTCRLTVFRLNSNGTLDTNFNGSGQYVYTAAQSSGNAIVVQGVGGEERIVIAGYTTSAALFRFRSNGTLDFGFGNSGIVVTDLGSYAQFLGLAVDSSNRLVAVGEGQVPVARYDLSGKLDPSFGNLGIVSPPVPSGNEAVAIQPDGYMLVAGAGGTSEAPSMIAFRFAPDGSLDPSFGDLGLVNEYFTDAHFAQGYALVLQADGKFVVGGLADGTDGVRKYRYAALARFWK